MNNASKIIFIIILFFTLLGLLEFLGIFFNLPDFFYKFSPYNFFEAYGIAINIFIAGMIFWNGRPLLIEEVSDKRKSAGNINNYARKEAKKERRGWMFIYLGVIPYFIFSMHSGSSVIGTILLAWIPGLTAWYLLPLLGMNNVLDLLLAGKKDFGKSLKIGTDYISSDYVKTIALIIATSLCVILTLENLYNPEHCNTNYSGGASSSDARVYEILSGEELSSSRSCKRKNKSYVWLTDPGPRAEIARKGKYFSESEVIKELDEMQGRGN